jgi:hypothetical protein
MDSDMLQLGFLKVLPGSPMAEIAAADPAYRWSETPPYEVLQSPALPYRDLCVLKDVEHLVDGWYNSGLVRKTLSRLAETREDGSAFALFRELSSFVRGFFPDGDLFLPRRPADVFSCLAAFIAGDRFLLEYLKLDFFLRGKPGSIPGWMTRRYSREAHEAALVDRGFYAAGPDGFAPSRRTVFARSDYDEFVFSADGKRERILFVYAQKGEKEKEAEVVLL